MKSNLKLKDLETNFNIDSVRSEVLFTVNTDGTITDIQSSSTYVLGLESKAMIGINFSSFLIDEYKDFDFFHSMLPRDKIKLTFINNNGPLHTELIYQQIFDPNNNVIGALGSITNITSHIVHKQTLDMINSLLDNSRDIIYHYQIIPEPKFIYISKSIENILGHSLENDYEDPTYIFKITHPDDLADLEKKATGKIDYSKPLITRWLHSNGNYIWMEDYAIPVYDYNGNITNVHGICRDITEKIKLQEKLKDLISKEN